MWVILESFYVLSIVSFQIAANKTAQFRHISLTVQWFLYQISMTIPSEMRQVYIYQYNNRYKIASNINSTYWSLKLTFAPVQCTLHVHLFFIFNCNAYSSTLFIPIYRARIVHIVQLCALPLTHGHQHQ